jgi:hypothetical protein
MCKNEFSRKYGVMYNTYTKNTQNTRELVDNMMMMAKVAQVKLYRNSWFHHRDKCKKDGNPDSIVTYLLTSENTLSCTSGCKTTLDV